MTKRQVIALIVQSWSLFHDRKLRHAWVRAKMQLNGRPIKVPMALPKEEPMFFPRTYKEANNGCPIYRSEFAKVGRYFSIHFWSLN